MSDDLNSLISYDNLQMPDAIKLYTETDSTDNENILLDTDFDNPNEINNDLTTIGNEELLPENINSARPALSESESESDEHDSENSEENVKTLRNCKVRFN